MAAKLTDSQILEIAQHAGRTMSNEQLAKKFDCRRQAINQVIANLRRWGVRVPKEPVTKYSKIVKKLQELDPGLVDQKVYDERLRKTDIKI